MNRMALLCVAAIGLSIGLSCDSEDQPVASNAPESPRPEAAEAPGRARESLYAFELPDIDGNMGRMADYRGKVLLLVNVASKCGYTKQYAGLQALYERYREPGLVVMGFPANNFGGQEPGTNEQIKRFCSLTYGVSFPMFAKISVKGDDMHPFYRFLTSPHSNPGFAGDITWNFNKFLISRTGEVIGRYDSPVDPLDERLAADIKNALAGEGGG